MWIGFDIFFNFFATFASISGVQIAVFNLLSLFQWSFSHPAALSSTSRLFKALTMTTDTNMLSYVSCY